MWVGNIHHHRSYDNLLAINPLKITTMVSNGMNRTKAFQDTIAQYLLNRAENVPLLAVKLTKPSKAMEQCCAYIIGEVKKSGFTEDEIFCVASSMIFSSTQALSQKKRWGGSEFYGSM